MSPGPRFLSVAGLLFNRSFFRLRQLPVGHGEDEVVVDASAFRQLQRSCRCRDSLLPVTGAAVAAPGAVHLHLALTLDAGRNERQRVQPRDRDSLVATFTDAIRARLESGQRPLDLVQFARLEFGQLRGHFLAARVKGQVGTVSR